MKKEIFKSRVLEFWVCGGSDWRVVDVIQGRSCSIFWSEWTLYIHWSCITNLWHFMKLARCFLSHVLDKNLISTYSPLLLVLYSMKNVNWFKHHNESTMMRVCVIIPRLVIQPREVYRDVGLHGRVASKLSIMTVSWIFPIQVNVQI